MDGRQLSSLLARTEQKAINACKKDGINHFHALRENVNQFGSCPALGAALHCSLLRLTLALKLSSIQTFCFLLLFFFSFIFFPSLIVSFVKFNSITPVPVFQDSSSVLAALLKSGFGLAFLPLGRFAGLLLQCLCCCTVGTEKCQNKCRKMCQLLVHTKES